MLRKPDDSWKKLNTKVKAGDIVYYRNKMCIYLKLIEGFRRTDGEFGNGYLLWNTKDDDYEYIDTTTLRSLKTTKSGAYAKKNGQHIHIYYALLPHPNGQEGCWVVGDEARQYEYGKWTILNAP